MRRLHVLCLMVVVIIGTISLGFAQYFRSESKNANPAGISQSPSDQYPPGTIDGATHPELISDLKAYEVFTNCVAIAESAPASEKKSAKDKFRRARLNESDTSAVMKTLGEFFAQRLDIIRQSEQLTQNKASNSDFAQLYSQSLDLVSFTRETLMSRLSPEGAAKLHAHVMDLKSRIKIFPPNVK
jgi:hypothetical protein